MFRRLDSVCLEEQPTQLGPVYEVSLWLQTPATTPTGFIKPTEHRPSMTVNIFQTLNPDTC
jgi:hypothetical protein